MFSLKFMKAEIKIFFFNFTIFFWSVPVPCASGMLLYGLSAGEEATYEK